MFGKLRKFEDSVAGHKGDPVGPWLSRATKFLGNGPRLITLLGCAGVIAIIAVGASGDTNVGNVLAELAVALLGAAVVVGFVAIVFRAQVTGSTELHESNAKSSGQRSRDRWLIGALVVLAGSAVQSWFILGTVIAGWDTVPPEGTAWIGKLFTPWIWSGSNLGGPAAQELQLPWATVLWIVNSLGGSAELAQRLWFTFLVVAVVLSAYGLLRLLRITAFPAAVGSLIYVFNPNSFVTAISPAYLTSMLLLVGLPAIVLAAATKRWSLKTALILIVLTTPLLGYTYQNPPLTGMVGLAFLASIAIAWILEGRNAGKEAAKVVFAGGLLLIVTSAYWLVPSLIELKGFALTTYAPVSSWIWEEARTTIENGLWLNTTWAWGRLTFYPFSANYAVFPLSFVKFLLPVTAFLALPLYFRKDASNHFHQRRLVVGATGLALFLIVLGTGTRWPGSIIFDPLYNLPLGWLIREPFRFLLIVGLVYGVLVALTLQSLAETCKSVAFKSFQNPIWKNNFPKFVSVFVTLIVLVPAYPLILGQIVPGTSSNQTIQYGAHHVKFPRYWMHMANFLNGRSAPIGNLLALPPGWASDMLAYKWGYIGVDAFMFDLLKRNVLAPNASNYYAASPELIDSVNMMTADLLSHNWVEVSDLANAVGVTLVLVRGDVDESVEESLLGYGYTGPSPSAIDAAMVEDPYFELVHRDGPLALFRLAPTTRPRTLYATVNTSTPNLADLTELPFGTSIVTSKQRKGVDAILEFPSLANWKIKSGVISSSVLERSGWSYHLGWITSSTSSEIQAGIPSGPEVIPKYTTRSMATLRGIEFKVSIPVIRGKSLVRDGNFAQGAWQTEVSDCSNGGVPKSLSSTGLLAQIRANWGPYGTRSLVLSANADSACESTILDWKSGPILVSLWAKNVEGGPPQVCVWQYPEYGCAPNTNLSSSSKWQHFQFAIDPKHGTTSLGIYLYGNTTTTGQKTVSEYSGVEAIQAPTQSLQPVVTGIPLAKLKSPQVLTALDEAYEPGWVAPRNFTRVLIDGLRVGWLGSSQATHIRYEPERKDEEGLALSAAGLIIFFGLIVATTIRRRATRNKES